ncbi:hypothetical protein SBY92_002306 [Candida maltosa Xu316]
MISFQSITKSLITIVPELSYVIPIFQYYYYYLYSLVRAISTINYQNILKESSKIIFSLYKNEGAFYDLWFSCNIITIVTSVIWMFLKYQSNNKSYNAFIIITISSLVRFASVSFNQIDTFIRTLNIVAVSSPRFKSHSPIVKILQSDNTCMFVIAELFFESKECYSKVMLLLIHSIFSLLGIFDFELTKRSIPYKEVFLFVFGILENWLLVVLWIEFKDSRAILYSMCYLLKWQGNTARQSVLLLLESVSYFFTSLKNEIPRKDPKRISSFGFDCFSIITDIN